MPDISVEVVYALPEKQYQLYVKVEQGSTIEQAILKSGLLELRREIDLASNKVGIYSRPVKLDDVVNEGDRIEVYRPLIADPKSYAGSAQNERQKAKNKPLSHQIQRIPGIKKALSAPFCCLLFLTILRAISRCSVTDSACCRY